MTDFLSSNKEYDLFHIRRLLKQGAYGPSLMSKFSEDFKGEIMRMKKGKVELKASCEKVKNTKGQFIPETKRFPELCQRKTDKKLNFMPLNEFSLPKVKEKDSHSTIPLKSTKSGSLIE